MAPTKSFFPADPKKRLEFVLQRFFGNSPLRLALAAGITRAAVNKWPPATVVLMDKHLLVAIDHELTAASDRVTALLEARAGIQRVIENLTPEDLKALRRLR
jgi:hypothetical protein